MEQEPQMTESEMREVLEDALYESHDDVQRTVPFAEVGLLTGNEGLVVRCADGSEFQVTVVKSA